MIYKMKNRSYFILLSTILLLIDQKDSAGENVLFFNKEVKTQIGFLKIARKFNLPIIPIKNTRLDNGKIELNFLDPIFHNDEKICKHYKSMVTDTGGKLFFE